MNTLIITLEDRLTSREVRAVGTRIVYGTIPKNRPYIRPGQKLIAIIELTGGTETRDITDFEKYAKLVSQATQPGAYFKIESMYIITPFDASLN